MPSRGYRSQERLKSLLRRADTKSVTPIATPRPDALDAIAEWIVTEFGFPFDVYTAEPPPECLAGPLVEAWRRSPLSGAPWEPDEEAFYWEAVRSGHD